MSFLPEYLYSMPFYSKGNFVYVSLANTSRVRGLPSVHLGSILTVQLSALAYVCTVNAASGFDDHYLFRYDVCIQAY